MSESLLTVRPPMIIEQVENQLLEALKSGLSGQCKVEAFPNDPAKYDFANLPAALLVHYAASTYGQPTRPADASQARVMQWQLVLLCRSLRGPGGAYAHLEDARLAVHGRAFAGAGPVRIVRDGLDDEKDGVWRWRMTIAMPIPAVVRRYQTPAPLMRPAISPET